jgi:NADH-quinone oxidoreductase subunit M
LNFDSNIAGIQPQFFIKVPWISAFHINYTLGVDGISLPMIVLNGLLFFLCILCSWKIDKSPKAYFSLLLMLEASVFGVFLSLDFFLFYVFWEVMTVDKVPLNWRIACFLAVLMNFNRY